MSADESGIIIIGAGGHSKVVIGVLRACNRLVQGMLDDDEAKRGKTFHGVPVLGPIGQLDRYRGAEAIIAIGDNHTRARIASSFKHAVWTNAIHPFAYVDPSAKVGPGSVVFAGAIVQADAQIGAHAIINTGATADHENQVGDFAHLCPGVHLGGAVTVEEGAFLGLGAVVLPGLTVGSWATVGAGAVVIRNVAKGLVVAGVPARLLVQSRAAAPLVLEA
jgi:sugar O-acyltransferase (sialic acid O-acetyltransferase NeuD family)